MSQQPPSSVQEVVERLRKAFPDVALKTRQIGGGGRATYIDGATCIRRLINATGGVFDIDVERYEEEPYTTKNKDGKEIKHVLVKAVVALHVPGLGKRTHIGVQDVTIGSGEDLYKGAVTDGIKKAATLFGVALELYGEDREQQEADRGARAEKLDFFFRDVRAAAEKDGTIAAQQMLRAAADEWMDEGEVKMGVRVYREIERKHGPAQKAEDAIAVVE